MKKTTLACASILIKYYSVITLTFFKCSRHFIDIADTVDAFHLIYDQVGEGGQWWTTKIW